MNARLQFLALVLGFVLWAVLGIMKFVPLDPLIALLQMGLGGLITHMLKSGPRGDFVEGLAPATAQFSPPGRTQAGFASIRLLGVLVMLSLVAASLVGCAGLNTAWVLHMEYATPQDKLAPVVPAAPVAEPEGKKT